MEPSNDVKSPATSAVQAHMDKVGSRKRTSMSLPRRKLEVPELDGFRLYWFKSSNVSKALQGGYDYVNMDEVPNFADSPANNTAIPTSNNLGSRITVNSGMDERGQPEELVLMKIPFEWYQEDQKVLTDRNAQILGAIFQHEEVLGQEQQTQEDRRQTYVKTAETSMPKKPKILNRAPPKHKT